MPTRHDSDEHIEPVRMTLAAALARVFRGEIVDAKSALSLAHAAHRLGRLA